MLPTAPSIEIGTDLETQQIISKTYKITGNRIAGFVDGVDAVRQAVYKILQTERYEHIIYSFDYGVEYKDLIGQSQDFVKNEFQRVTTEALREDLRILSVSDFTFTFTENYLTSTFKVKSIEGNFVVEIQI